MIEASVKAISDMMNRRHSPTWRRQPAGQRHGNGSGNRIGTDDPGALVGADAQVAGNGRNGDVGDRRIQDFHEGAQRQPDGQQGELPRGKGLLVLVML